MNTALAETNTAIDRIVDHKRGYVDVTEAIKLRLKHNYSYQQLADRYNVSKQAVHQALRKFTAILNRPDSISTFNEIRSDVLTAVEIKLIQSLLDPDKHKSASLNNVAYAYNTIYIANRTEKGHNDNANVMLLQIVCKDAVQARLSIPVKEVIPDE